MEKLKCALCDKEIEKNEKYGYVGNYFDKNSKLISTQRELIGKPICLSEFYDANSQIIFYNGKKSLSFSFKDGVVFNSLASSIRAIEIKIFSKDLKNICDIAREYSLNPNGKEKIGNLIRVEQIPENKNNEDIISDLQDFLLLVWRSKGYFVETPREGIFNNINIYVENANKENFIRRFKSFELGKN